MSYIKSGISCCNINTTITTSNEKFLSIDDLIYKNPIHCLYISDITRPIYYNKTETSKNPETLSKNREKATNPETLSKNREKATNPETLSKNEIDNCTDC